MEGNEIFEAVLGIDGVLAQNDALEPKLLLKHPYLVLQRAQLFNKLSMRLKITKVIPTLHIIGGGKIEVDVARFVRLNQDAQQEYNWTSCYLNITGK